jgi:hypothetical protein
MNTRNQNNETLYTLKESFLVVLDSRNSTIFNNGDMISDISFDLKDIILTDDSTIALNMVLSSFTCPCSFYQINNNNNILNIVLNNVQNSIIIPVGNYNQINFQSQLLSQLPSDFSMSFNKINNIYTLNSSSTSFIISSTSTIYNIMGFKKNMTYIANSNNNGGFTLLMPYCCNFGGLNNINIHCKNIRTKNIDSKDMCISSIIASVPVNASPNGIIYYGKNADFSIPIKTSCIDYIDIELKDDLNNFINMNNQHFNLVLQFDVIHDVERFKDSFQNILQHSLIQYN